MEVRQRFFKNTISRDLTLIILALAIIPIFATGYFTTLLGKVIILAIFAISLDIAWGYGGILSLGHSVFFGLGAYAFTLTSINGETSISIIIGILLGILLPALLAGIVSLFVFFAKTTPFYIGVLTLSLAIVAERLTVRFSSFTGGQNGISGVPSFPFSGTPLYYTILILFIIIIYFTYRFVNSDMGKLMTAVRENEEKTRFLGYSTPIIRMLIFMISGAVAGLAGVLYAPYNGFISPSLLAFVLATEVIIWVAIGGRGKIIGAVIGAILINLLSPYFNDYFPFIWQILLGLLFIIAVVFFPNGLYSLIKSKKSESNYQIESKSVGSVVDNISKEVLSIQNVEKSFGNLTILKDLNLTINSGEIQCIIGPNGAGKSTLINAITGKSGPTSGMVILNGERIDKFAPEVIVRRGVARTFQATTIIGELTVAENLQLAAEKGKYPSLIQNKKVIELPPLANKLVHLSKLNEKLSLKGNELSHGDQQLLELCMALALEPDVLLLDEPTAGLNSIERKEIGKLLVQLAHEEGIALLVIEHDVDFVKEISDRVTVLYDGTIAADGTVDEVTQSELVKKVYLGGR